MQIITIIINMDDIRKEKLNEGSILNNVDNVAFLEVKLLAEDSPSPTSPPPSETSLLISCGKL